tara:strand:+ start:438 stop:986 length:549 start_codon:yes stop_codon:yes gene_type:complete
MKKKILVAFLSLLSFNSLYADERSIKLDELFNDLKNNDQYISNKIEQKIWKIWSTHPNNSELTTMLNAGSEFVNNNQLLEAIEIFTKVIELDPSWPEAWNKRATVFYMVGEFEKSQKDIDEVLKLENRHFGALAGQGLVNIKLENYDKAIKSYENVIEIYPSMNSSKIMIKHIKDLIKKQSI